MKKREQKRKYGLPIRIMSGTVVSCLLLLGTLFLAALLMSAGTVKIGDAKRTTFFLCAVSVFIGALFAVRGCGKKQWLIGISVGFSCYFVLLPAAVVCAGTFDRSVEWLPLLLISPIAGAMAGMLRSGRRKKHR